MKFRLWCLILLYVYACGFAPMWQLKAQTQPVLAVSITGIDTDISVNTDTVGPDGILDTDLGTDTKQVQLFNADGSPMIGSDGKPVYDTVLDPDLDLDLYDANPGNDYVSPANELSNVYGRTINIRAMAVGFFPDSGFTYEFFINNQSIGKPENPAAGSPGVLSWTPPQPGVYYIRVVASANGISAQSLAVRYFATGAVVSSPLPNTLVPQGSSVVVSADATGASGFVKHVQFYVNGVAFGDPDGTYPYSVVFQATGASGTTYDLTAIATDNDGVALPASPTVRIQTVTPIGVLPTIDIISPSVRTSEPRIGEAVVAYPSGSNTIPITVKADDSDGRVNKVELYIDGVLAVSDSTFPYSFDWSPTAVGQYKVIALVYDDKNNVVSSSSSGGPRVVNVTAPPVVTITKPSAGSTITAGSPYTIEVDASDSDGTVSSVQVFVDSSPVGVASETSSGSGHYTVSWTPVQKSDEEPTVISVLATDNLGIQTASSTVSVTVIGSGSNNGEVIGVAPTVQLTNPTDGANITAGSTVTLSATASDSDGNIAKVQFYVNDSAVDTGDTSFPYSVSWTPTNLGTYEIVARVTDDKGNVVPSSPRTVVVTAGSTGLPVVSLLSPSDNSSLTLGQSVALLANAKDTDGSISHVDFYSGGTRIGSDDTAPYSLDWTPSSAADYTLTAVATDNGGNVVTSVPVTLYVRAAAGAAPTATLSVSGPSGQVTSGAGWASPVSVAFGSRLLISAQALDSDGAISKVDFFANGQLLISDGSAPYYVSWTVNSLNTVVLTAVVTDSSGNVTHPYPVLLAPTSVGDLSGYSVTLESPVSGATLVEGASIVLRSSTTLGASFSPSVDYYVNGKLSATASSSPYQVLLPISLAGRYDVHAVVRGGGAVLVSNLARVVVTGNSSPIVSMITPLSGATVEAGTAVDVSASASDSDGLITLVEFFGDGALIGSDSSAPYEATFTPGSAGTHTVYAIATDNSGRSTVSSSVSFTATAVSSNQAPVVVVTNPSAGTALTVGAAISVAATATDVDGNVASVEFFANGNSIGVDSVFPYSVTWTPQNLGTYSITAKATDNKNKVGTSSAVSVTVGSNSGGSPVVYIVSPATNVSAAVNDTLAIVALAGDPDGTVSNVEFYVNGVSMGSSTSSPYLMTWTPLNAGVYRLTAAVTDNAGNRVVSSPVSVSVVNASGSLPIASIGFNAPAVDAGTDTSSRLWTEPYEVSYLSKLLISADAVDVDGSVARVDFYANGQLIASDSSAPYYTVWTLDTLNDVAITAVAVDSNGNPYHTFPILIDTKFASASSATVTLNSPVNGASYTAGGQILFNASTTFGNQPVPKVDFYVNGAQFLTATTEPFQKSMGLSVPGVYDVHAVVRTGTRTTVSSMARIQVLPNGAPTVSLTAPTNGGTYTLGSSINLAATAADADGTISQVEFFANGTSIGTDALAPFTLSYTPPAEGTYRLTAVATDNSQAATTSSASTVLVVSASAVTSTSVYRGTFAVGTESIQFSSVNAHGVAGMFIAHSAVGTANPKIYFYPSFTYTALSSQQAQFTATGSLNGTASTLAGVFSSTGVTAGIDGKTFPLIIGTITQAGSTTFPAGYYMGSLTDRPATQLVGILSPDGAFTLYVSDGTNRNAGTGVVSTSGSVSISLVGGGTFTGTVDFTGGLLTGTISGGSVTGAVSAALSTGSSFSDGALRGVSTRGLVGSGENVMIAGFSINGTLSKTVIIRALGPSLAGLGVSNPVADPLLELYSGNTRIAVNDDWATPASTAPTIVSASKSAGLISLANGSLDSVLYRTLTPGTYTAVVKAKTTSGVGLVEVYDGDAAESFSQQKVIAISTRGRVGSGENVMISGFAVSGSSAKKVLIRAVGPTLTSFGVTNALSDPKITLQRLTSSATTLVRENDNWETGNDRALVMEAASRSYLFPLAAGSKDSAILLSLPPGNYSATVSGADNTEGVVLMEVYEVP